MWINTWNKAIHRGCIHDVHWQHLQGDLRRDLDAKRAPCLLCGTLREMDSTSSLNTFCVSRRSPIWSGVHWVTICAAHDKQKYPRTCCSMQLWWVRFLQCRPHLSQSAKYCCANNDVIWWSCFVWWFWWSCNLLLLLMKMFSECKWLRIDVVKSRNRRRAVIIEIIEIIDSEEHTHRGVVLSFSCAFIQLWKSDTIELSKCRNRAQVIASGDGKSLKRYYSSSLII